MSELTVPGKFKCDKCGFVLMSTNLYVKSGTIGPNYDAHAEPCPNDGEKMRPFTWKEEAKLGDELIARLFARHDELVDTLKAAAAAMSAINRCRDFAGDVGRERQFERPEKRHEIASAFSGLDVAEHDLRKAIEDANAIPGSPVPVLVEALRAWESAEAYAQRYAGLNTPECQEEKAEAWAHAIALRDAQLAKYSPRTGAAHG
jgi:hypothetical protein